MAAYRFHLPHIILSFLLWRFNFFYYTACAVCNSTVSIYDDFGSLHSIVDQQCTRLLTYMLNMNIFITLMFYRIKMKIRQQEAQHPPQRTTNLQTKIQNNYAEIMKTKTQMLDG